MIQTWYSAKCLRWKVILIRSDRGEIVLSRRSHSWMVRLLSWSERTTHVRAVLCTSQHASKHVQVRECTQWCQGLFDFPRAYDGVGFGSVSELFLCPWQAPTTPLTLTHKRRSDNRNIIEIQQPRSRCAPQRYHQFQLIRPCVWWPLPSAVSI